MLDAQGISKKALDYFVTIHGDYAVWGFQIEEVTPSKDGKTWTVKCSFAPNPNLSKRFHYELVLDSGDGTILTVKRLRDSGSTVKRVT